MAADHSSAPDPPSALPANPALARLAVFIGTWAWEAALDGQPIGGGRSVFAWLEGGAFLIQHDTAEQPEFPNATTIIGADDATGAYCLIQVDSRGITRIYQMRLGAGRWKLWRDAPGFFQRFTGTFSADGSTIGGRYEKSDDSTQWGYDFDITYTRLPEG